MLLQVLMVLLITGLVVAVVVLKDQVQLLVMAVMVAAVVVLTIQMHQGQEQAVLV